MRAAFVLPFLIGLAAAPGAAYKAPVAVLPFKNLNDDPASNWLKLGVAETMISDLKKAKVTVVERDQIDKALGEVLLQGGNPTEEAVSLKVGKLVGAKTVVAGSFQAAGKKLRFNARFVEVETGVVLDTAKATGPIDAVFSLQDEMVDRLLGSDAKSAQAARPQRKSGAKTVEAYKQYSMSLATSSEAEKIGYLKKSLELDPAFVYAADELAALEKRMSEYTRTRDRWIDDEDKAIWKILEDPAVDAQTKSLQAGILIGRKSGQRRVMAQIADAKRIVSLNLPDPPPGVVPATETALFTIMSGYQQLQKSDLALQAGEEVLRRYPHGVWFNGVRTQMQILVDAKKKMENEGRPEIEKRYAEIEVELGKLEAELRRPDLIETRKVYLDMERCSYAVNRDPERAVRECRAFVDAWTPKLGTTTNVNVPYQLRVARFYEIRSLFYSGRWEELMPKARAMIAENPNDEFGKDLRNDLERNWPVDAVPEK